MTVFAESSVKLEPASEEPNNSGKDTSRTSESFSKMDIDAAQSPLSKRLI
jgi:hypothetical protein